MIIHKNMQPFSLSYSLIFAHIGVHFIYTTNSTVMERPIINYITRKNLKSVLLFIFCALLVSGSLFAQPQLIPPGANYDPYPIIFTDEAQRQIVITLTEDVTVSSSPTNKGWTFTVGGVTKDGSGPLVDKNTLTFQLPVGSIPYAQRLDVMVSYDGTGDIEGDVSELQLGVISSTQAINNLKWGCAGLTGVQSIGTVSLTPCAATKAIFSVEYSVKQNARNSIHWNLLYARMRFQDPLNPTTTSFLMVEQGAVGSGNFRVETSEFTYQVQDACSFYPYVWPVFVPTNGYASFNCSATSARMDYAIPSYQLDNQFSGDLLVYPEIDNPLNLYCVGENIANHIFEDNTDFNCRFEVEPNRPNVSERVVQFIYGTNVNGNPRIPNVYIDVSGTPVQITDATGNLISGVYEGPVFHYDTPPLPGDEFSTYPTHQAYSISHTGDFTDAENMRFEVTLRMWGPCNIYDPFDPTSNMIEETSYIELIGSPLAPTATSPSYCYTGLPAPDLTATGTTGTLDWWSDSDCTVWLATGGSFTHGETAAGIYTYYVNETLGNGCPGPATEVTLTINPLPNAPTISVTGDLEFCWDGGITFVQLTANPVTPPAVTSYQWYKDGAPMTDSTAASIILSDDDVSGSYTVRALGEDPTNCLGAESLPADVIAHSLSNLTQPVPVTVCEDEIAVFSAITTDDVASYKWEVSTDGGSIYNVVGAAAPYSGFNTNTLTITNPDFSLDGNLYRCELKTPPGQGGCPFKSDGALLTVYAIPTADAGAAVAAICQGGTTVALGGSFDGGATAAVWDDGGAGGSFANNGINSKSQSDSRYWSRNSSHLSGRYNSSPWRFI